MGNGSPPASSRRVWRSGPARLRACRWLVLACGATGLLGAAADARSAGPSPPPLEVCIALDPLLRLGCAQQPQQDRTPAPAPGQARPASEPEQTVASAPVLTAWSGPRYDPRRLTVPFKAGAAPSALAPDLPPARGTAPRGRPKPPPVT